MGTSQKQHISSQPSVPRSIHSPSFALPLLPTPRLSPVSPCVCLRCCGQSGLCVDFTTGHRPDPVVKDTSIHPSITSKPYHSPAAPAGDPRLSLQKTIFLLLPFHHSHLLLPPRLLCRFLDLISRCLVLVLLLLVAAVRSDSLGFPRIQLTIPCSVRSQRRPHCLPERWQCSRSRQEQ